MTNKNSDTADTADPEPDKDDKKEDTRDKEFDKYHKLDKDFDDIPSLLKEIKVTGKFIFCFNPPQSNVHSGDLKSGRRRILYGRPWSGFRMVRFGMVGTIAIAVIDV